MHSLGTAFSSGNHPLVVVREVKVGRQHPAAYPALREIDDGSTRDGLYPGRMLLRNRHSSVHDESQRTAADRLKATMRRHGLIPFGGRRRRDLVGTLLEHRPLDNGPP